MGFAIVILVIILATFTSPTTPENSYKNRGISIAGLVIFYLGLYATSANRKKIVWRTVLVGLLCQFLLALFVLRTDVGYDIFNFISFLAR
jgi:concentrative nucleoside transporter, CNT family